MVHSGHFRESKFSLFWRNWFTSFLEPLWSAYAESGSKLYSAPIESTARMSAGSVVSGRKETGCRNGM